jgi:hypothetical protein
VREPERPFAFQVVKEAAAMRQPYGEWLKKELFTLGEWEDAATKRGSKPPGFAFADTNRRLNLFGYTTVLSTHEGSGEPATLCI